MPNNPKGRGVLPINPSATRKPFKQTPRPPAPRLRLIIRRLPPGLTESEFWEYLGKEWQVGQGKVDWAAFKPGKISTDLAKPSRPSRAYIKVKETSQIELLSNHVRSIVFQDAKNSSRDLSLVGPPSLEYAPYNKIPSGRTRHDGRQGTIDQDPEFIDFLQSLTEPITKPAANGETDLKHEKVTITPLVQYIKEKKANKAKEKEAAAAAKSGKKAEAKDAKNASPAKPDQQTIVKKSTTSDAEKARVAKATQDVVKAINTLSKSAAAQQTKATPAKTEVLVKEPTTPTQPTPKRERQRGDVNAAARIISRDLGLTPKEGRSSRTSKVVATPNTVPASAATPVTPATPSTPKAIVPPPTPTPAASTKQTQPQPPTGPRNLRNTTPQPTPVRSTTNSQPQAQTQTPKANAKPPPQPTAGAKSAFLKHANPSQGITEELLRTKFSMYGTITRCEIDKKKGLGYLDFTETEALKKAMAASPVKIANGSVVVLENRSPYRKQGNQNKTGSATASASTSVASSPKIAQAALSSIAEATTVQPPASVPSEVKKTESLPTSVAPESAASTNETVSSATPGPPATAATASDPTSTPAAPSAPKAAGGGRSGGRGHYRGRGGFRGRGGQRGGNRAASTSTPTANGGNAAPTTPSGGDNKT